MLDTRTPQLRKLVYIHDRLTTDGVRRWFQFRASLQALRVSGRSSLDRLACHRVGPSRSRGSAELTSGRHCSPVPTAVVTTHDPALDTNSKLSN